jgi:general secretion pathway protein A
MEYFRILNLKRELMVDGKLIGLLIDEGQKLPRFCLEILREFLNYETNHGKLLQIVIFTQKHFREKIDAYANLGRLILWGGRP